MRIAVLLRDRCQPKKCNYECINYCPPNRSGKECIVQGGSGKAVISEEMCIGCGICVHKCPFDAIRIINLPELLENDLIHQYGLNGFRLFRLPTPTKGKVVGLLGPNGIGKTTIIHILAGLITPNLGDYENEASWDRVVDYFAGTDIQEYLRELVAGDVTPALKPQYVDKLASVHKGKVQDLLAKSTSDLEKLKETVTALDLLDVLDRDISHLSGGELQRMAIAATLLRDADIYFFDEPSSYLDIYQRLRVARVIKKLSETKQVMLIEHDLAILDFLADNVYVMFGDEGAYGALAHPRAVRSGINAYLSGNLKEENIRFREKGIEFTTHPPRENWAAIPLIDYDALEMNFDKFKLKTEKGTICHGEVVGILGPNATGKTTFVKMLAGELKPTVGEITEGLKVSYKPQYLKPEFDGTVRELFYTLVGSEFESSFSQAEIVGPLRVNHLMERKLESLSGGELQRVSIALCLSRKADIYLVDEPSAYLDSNQRMETARTLRRVMEKYGKSALVVDHDVYFIDLVADRLMVFSGDSSKYGKGEGPFGLREGMNRFLADVDITFRRDAQTNRPRINKEDSVKDREQKAKGEYYYDSME